MSQSNTNTRCAEEYTVKRGDSFYLIAHKLGVPLRDLLAANSDIHPARLMVGDVLCIPREEDDSPQNGGLGGSTPTTPDIGNTGAGNAGIAPDPTLPCPGTEQYTIQPGQTVADLQLQNLVSRHTLESVAMRYNLPVASLLRVNPCLAPQDFEPGVTVVLPR